MIVHAPRIRLQFSDTSTRIIGDRFHSRDVDSVHFTFPVLNFNYFPSMLPNETHFFSIHIRVIAKQSVHCYRFVLFMIHRILAYLAKSMVYFENFHLKLSPKSLSTRTHTHTKPTKKKVGRLSFRIYCNIRY